MTASVRQHDAAARLGVWTPMKILGVLESYSGLACELHLERKAELRCPPFDGYEKTAQDECKIHANE